MGIEITDFSYTPIDPRTVDFDKLPDKEFHARKFVQAFTLLPKIGGIIKLIAIEKANIEQQKVECPAPKTFSEGMSIRFEIRRIDTTTLSSLNFSVLLLQFTYIEALCNVVAESTIRKNMASNKLSEVELDFLSEQSSTYKKGKIEKKTTFVRLEEKVIEYIALLAKVNDQDYKLDTGIQYWGDFKTAKTLRDQITHPKNGVHTAIDFDVVFSLSKFIYWYTKEVSTLYTDHFDFKEYKWIENYSYGCVSLINKIRGGNEDDFREINNWHKELI